MSFCEVNSMAKRKQKLLSNTLPKPIGNQNKWRELITTMMQIEIWVFVRYGSHRNINFGKCGTCINRYM